MQTELGKIAALLATTTDEATPLQRRLEQVGASCCYSALDSSCWLRCSVCYVLALARGATDRGFARVAASPKAGG